MSEDFIPVRVAILTVSDRRGAKDDTSGQLLFDRVQGAGHQVVNRQWVRDDRYLIRASISNWLVDDTVQVIITTGGTGLTGRDGTPEAVLPLFDKAIDGFGELFRALSYAQIRTSTIQSRAIAGLANGRLIFCLPGSPDACELAWDDILCHQLDARHRPCNFVDLMPRLLER